MAVAAEEDTAMAVEGEGAIGEAMISLVVISQGTIITTEAEAARVWVETLVTRAHLATLKLHPRSFSKVVLVSWKPLHPFFCV